MKIENFLSLISKEANNQINEIHNTDHGLTWAESDQIGYIRFDLREIIGILTSYADDLSKDEIIDYLFSNGLSQENELVYCI